MTSWHQPSDSSFLLAMLKDGKRHSTNEIIQASLAERKVGLTVHSRAADLRARGHNVICESGPRRHGRTTYFYRLASLPESSQSSVRFGERSTRNGMGAGRDDSGSAPHAPSSAPPEVDPGEAELSPVSPDQLALPLPGSALKTEQAA